MNGYSPGRPRSRSSSSAGDVGGRVEVTGLDPGRGLEPLAALRGGPKRLGAEGLPPAVAGRVRALPDRAMPALGLGHARTRSTSPSSTVAPAPTATRSTVPSRGDRSSFCIFIASTVRSCWPAVTTSPGAHRDGHDPPRDDGTDLGAGRAGRATSRPRVARSRSSARSASSTSNSNRQPSTTTSIRRPGPRRRASARAGRGDAGEHDGAPALVRRPSGSASIAARGDLGDGLAGIRSVTEGPPHRGHRSTRRLTAGRRATRCATAGTPSLVHGLGGSAGADRRHAEPSSTARPGQARRRLRRARPARPGRPSGRRPSRSTGRPPGSPGPGPPSGGTAASSGCRRPRPRRALDRAGPGRASRSAAWTMILAMRLSYSGGMRSPSASPVSTRTPGPDGIDPSSERPGRRREVAGRVLGREPDLDRVARPASPRARPRPGRRPTAARRPPAGTARGRGRGRSPAPSRRAPPGDGC